MVYLDLFLLLAASVMYFDKINPYYLVEIPFPTQPLCQHNYTYETVTIQNIWKETLHNKSKSDLKNKLEYI